MGKLPIKLGISNALVFFVIFFSIFLTSICKVSISQSTNIGTRLLKVIDEIAVPKLRHGIMISLPFLKFTALSAKRRAEDPELPLNHIFLKIV